MTTTPTQDFAGAITDPGALYRGLTHRKRRVRFTLRSAVTGARLTYQLAPVKDKANRWFLSLLTGSDNDADYSYIGLVERDDTGRLSVRTTRRGRPESCPSVRGARYVLRDLPHALRPGIEVWHEGRCMRCGRALTVPESIAVGLGPVCEGRI